MCQNKTIFITISDPHNLLWKNQKSKIFFCILVPIFFLALVCDSSKYIDQINIPLPFVPFTFIGCHLGNIAQWSSQFDK